MRIDHIVILTKDLEKLRSFYETYFQAKSNNKYVNKTKGFSSYFLSFDSGSRLEIMQMDSIVESMDHSNKIGLTHLAVSVGSKEEVDQLTAKLKNEGFEIIENPRTTGDGYCESKVSDPDGNLIEITI